MSEHLRPKTLNVWERAELPEAHKVVALGYGQFLIFASFALAAVGGILIASHDPGTYSRYSGSFSGGTDTMAAGIWCAAIGGVLLPIGLLIVSVSVLVKELRRSAYEAALRAGEVLEKPAGPDKYEAYLASRKPAT